MNLEGKVAMVTGGSGGLGSVHCLSLARAGCNVAVIAHCHLDRAEMIAEEIRAMGRKALAVAMDVANSDEVEATVKKIEKVLGPIDILVNNAASGVARTALNLDIRGWDWTIDINARAFLLCAQRAAKLMKNGGKMVSISSLGSRLAWPIYTAVGVSKAALEALTRYLAIELAPRGICVNGVAACAVETEALKMYTVDHDLPEMYYQVTPAGRMIQPEDVARAVRYLASEPVTCVTDMIVMRRSGGIPFD